MTCFRLTLSLDEPLTIGASATVTNELRSLDYIPATALRGAFFEQLQSLGLEEGDAEQWFGPRGARWSPAWPSGCVPMPLCFYKAKRDGRFRGVHGVWNALSDAVRPDDYVELPKDRWLQRSNNPDDLDSYRVASDIDMHVALHYETQSARPGALFSREAIEAKSEPRKTRYEAWLMADRLPPRAEEIQHISLGKRRSVNGRCAVTRSEAEVPWNGTVDGNEAILQLLSPALIPGARGGWLRGLEASDFAALIGNGVSVDFLLGFSRSAPISGWSGSWKLPREQSIAILPGSCWRIRCSDSAKLASWLEGVRESGIGLRREEGFGWVAVNPPWLQTTLEAPFAQVSAAPGPSGHPPPSPLPWPGVSGSPDELRKLLRDAEQIANQLRDDHIAPLHDLLAIVERDSPQTAATFLAQRAGRKNPGCWEDIKNIEEKMSLGQAQAAFFLDAMITSIQAKRLGKPR